ncbi:MAG: DNA-binding response regulator [Candidatus Melainabacteria bacterium]|jgi:two-component response regulator|nr:MAG: DNA-binding response regulator [Candidatus Melainabacteria bacterium]
MSKSIKVTIIEDHDMTRMGLSFALSNNESIEVLGTASDGMEGVEQALDLKPDLVIMDIGLPTIDGIEATRKIKNSMPEIKVLMNTSRDNEDDILDSFAAGADGYITKGATSEQTISAIKAVSEGVGWLDPAIARVVLSNIRKNNPVESKTGVINYQKGKNLYGLTEREMEVLALLVEGLKNPQISKKLVITIATTKTHVHNILQKLYVKTRSKAVATAMKDGLV